MLLVWLLAAKDAAAQVSCPGGGTCPSGDVCEPPDPPAVPSEWCCVPNNACAVIPGETGLNYLNEAIPCGDTEWSQICTGQIQNCGDPCPSYGSQWSCSNGSYCTCAPMTEAQACAGKACGNVSDGCGGTLSCGSCASGQECTTGDTCCTPTSCAAQGAHCGSLPDECGGTLSCGSCTGGATCSEAFQCVGGCTSNACPAGATCGIVVPGCGNTQPIVCGLCGATQACENFQCVAGPKDPPNVPASNSASLSALVGGLLLVGSGLSRRRRTR